MLSNIPGTIFLVFILSVFSIGIITAIVVVSKSLILCINGGNSTKLKYNSFAIVLIVIAIISWILNMGWFRFILTILAVPIIHTTAFLIINNLSLSYVDKSKKLHKFVVLTYISYILPYLFFPDGADIGTMYVFFGLIHNDFIANLFFHVSYLTFICNIILLVLQLEERKMIIKENRN